MSVFNRVTERSHEDAIRLGRQAKEILDSEALYPAMEEAEIDFMEVMVLGESVEERETARCSIIALNGVLSALRNIQTDGEHAEAVIAARSEEE